MFIDTARDPSTLSADQLADRLNEAYAAREYLAALENEAKFRLLSGVRVNGFKLCHKRTIRRLKDGAEEALHARFGDAAYVLKLRSFTEFALLPGGKEAIDSLTYKPEGELELAAAGDKRPAGRIEAPRAVLHAV